MGDGAKSLKFTSMDFVHVQVWVVDPQCVLLDLVFACFSPQEEGNLIVKKIKKHIGEGEGEENLVSLCHLDGLG